MDRKEEPSKRYNTREYITKTWKEKKETDKEETAAGEERREEKETASTPEEKSISSGAINEKPNFTKKYLAYNSYTLSVLALNSVFLPIEFFC